MDQRSKESKTRLTRCVMADKLKVIVLVPVLQRQFLEWRCVGKLEVREVPVEDLAIFRAQVDVAVGLRSIFVSDVIILMIFLGQWLFLK